MKREDAIKQRREDPARRDEYLSKMKAAGDQLTEALSKNSDVLPHTCQEDPEHLCQRCSIGQEAADLVDEGIGIEGVDF